MKQTHRGVKTTIELPEPIWRAAKQRALDDGLDMRSIVIASLDRFLAKRAVKRDSITKRPL
jgi:hypothetical protein